VATAPTPLVFDFAVTVPELPLAVARATFSDWPR
jgi:hypothetical protein